MNQENRIKRLLTKVAGLAAPLHVFGGAVDIVVVKQDDGTYHSTPWYVQFGRFQGVLRGPDNTAKISVNGNEASFHMLVDKAGQAYFSRDEIDPEDSESVDSFRTCQEEDESDHMKYEDATAEFLQEPIVDSSQDEQTKSTKPDLPTRHMLLHKKTPTHKQIESLNLKYGENRICFSFCTRAIGRQQIDAHIYLLRSDVHIVISDVDGTITRSDVLGLIMPLVGKDWSQSGVTTLFSSIERNGYQLLFLSARAIVMAWLTRRFLFNLKQSRKALPRGPVLTSPDGAFHSFYREVIQRTPHEFKIACLQDIKDLFPKGYNPFYAGFGNRTTDEISYIKMGIPTEKIFIINPKGEVAIPNETVVESYNSLHSRVDHLFPPISLTGQAEDIKWNLPL